MNISSIFENAPSLEIKNIMTDSRVKLKDAIFFCVAGLVNDGHDFIDQAIENGAICIVHSRDLTDYRQGVTYIQVEDTLGALNIFTAAFYGDVTKKMKVYGVTGTNGKTTIAWVIRYLVSRFRKCGYIGTIGYMWDENIKDSFLTTPEVNVIHKMIKQIYNHHARAIAIEASSQGIDMRRVEAVDFDYAIFTNLTHDHLDYHLTMENYYQAKAKMFRNMPADKTAVINVDDEYAERLISETSCRVVTYGIDKPADYRAEDIREFADHTEFTLIHGEQSWPVNTNLVARFNVYNLLGVLATLMEDGYTMEKLSPYLATIPQVLGRAERIDEGQNFNVIVDYAHTPDGYEKIYDYVHKITPEDKRIISVFGAHGARDHAKRPMIGKIADKNSDVIILCSEDNHWEDPAEICRQIGEGITKHSYVYIEDRYDAIRQGIELANSGDTVCVLGKADEQYFKIGDGKVDWMGDDAACREILKNMLEGDKNEN